jgi:hypothetical protein
VRTKVGEKPKTGGKKGGFIKRGKEGTRITEYLGLSLKTALEAELTEFIK